MIHQISTYDIYYGQNGDIPLSLKLSSKISILRNYLGICSCFKLNFLKIELQAIKLKKIIIIKIKIKKLKILHETRVPCRIFQETRFSKNRVSNQRHIPKQFQIEGILLESFDERDILSFWPIYYYFFFFFLGEIF